MQKAISYTDMFHFFLHIPVAIFEDLNDNQIIQDCFEMEAYPLSIIRDNRHPLFIRLCEDFKRKGVTQELKSIVLAVGYTKQFLS